jgi:ABC-2 type transport system ATP-binding protein
VLPEPRSRVHAFTLIHSASGTSAADTFGRPKNLRKLQAGVDGPSFVGAGPYRQPCRLATPLACNEDMTTQAALAASARLDGRYHIDPASTPEEVPVLPDAVYVSGLRKSYGSVQAVRDVSFTVQLGEIVALLGPNGAGKTTTLEILEGFRKRDGGTAKVLGLDPADRSSARELRERTGLVLQDIAVEPYLTVGETIARAAGYYRAPRSVAEVIGAVGLAGLERRRVKNLSGGQKRRLDLALGLIGDPELLYLDEPTTGFDPAARRDAWQLVRNLRTAGTAILLTTHDMAEAQALADRVVLLSHGVVVADGSPSSLGGRDTDWARISFTLPAGYSPADLPLPATEANGVVVVETAAATEALNALTDWARGLGISLAGLTVERPSLEDVYLRLTKEEGTPEGGPERSTR